MTAETFIALLGAITALVVALGGVIVQLRQLRKDMNGRLSQLVEATALAAHSEGTIEGRAKERRALDLPPVPPRGGE